MKLVATSLVFVVAALVALSPAAAAGTTPQSDVQLSRSAQVPPPDLIERYVDSHPSSAYVMTRGLAPSPEALAAHTPVTSGVTDEYVVTRGLAPSPEVLAARGSASGDTGFTWGDASIGAGLFFIGLLLATGAAVAMRHSRNRVANA
jgi:hypothetical protein